jgi:hypothetical protein
MIEVASDESSLAVGTNFQRQWDVICCTFRGGNLKIVDGDFQFLQQDYQTTVTAADNAFLFVS